MESPAHNVTLSVPQVEELARHLSSFRHDVNGCLALVVAATELIRYNPDVIKRMGATLVEQPPKIAGKVREFCAHCERALGLRPPTEAAWYPALWRRGNMVTTSPSQTVPLTADDARALHNELMQMGKELTQLGFIISGAQALASVDESYAAGCLQTMADQFTKTAAKFDHYTGHFEQVSQIIEAGDRRHAGGSCPGPVTLKEAQIELFRTKLVNLQQDMHVHLTPLLALSRLVRESPRELQARVGEFAQASPKISGEVTAFSTEFDKTFGIMRSTPTAS